MRTRHYGHLDKSYSCLEVQQCSKTALERKRRDVATATAKLLGSVMDIGGGGVFEGEKEEDEENVVPIVFSNATDSEFETLGLKKSGKKGEGIRAPILLPSPKKKKEEKSENLVQRFREFSTTKDVLNVRGVRARSAIILIKSLKY